MERIVDVSVAVPGIRIARKTNDEPVAGKDVTA